MPVNQSLYQEAGNVSVDPQRCIRCGQCVSICPAEVLALEKDQVQRFSSGFDCIACGHCKVVCPQGCMEALGPRQLS